MNNNEQYYICKSYKIKPTIGKYSLKSATYLLLMKFNVKQRDGPARVGELTIVKKMVITPNILFIDTDRFKAPSFADIILTNIDSKTDKPVLKFSNNLLLEKFIIDQNEDSLIKTINDDISIVLFATQ